MPDDHAWEDIHAASSNATVPKALRQRAKAFPFLGTLSCSHDALIAGAWDEIVLEYTVGESGIADGARLKIAFKFYTDWALFQTSDPTAANYVSAEYAAGSLVEGQSPATVQALKVTFDQKGHERPFQKALLIDIVDGYLNPGDHITIRLGDRRGRGPGTRVQTFEEKGFTFRAFVDPLGTSKFAPVPGDVTIDFLAGPPAALSIMTSRLARCGEQVPVRIRAFDRWGNSCLGLTERLELRIDTGVAPGETQTHAFPGSGWAVVKLDLATPMKAGEIKLTARIPALPRLGEATATLRIDPELRAPRAWFADLHVHSEDTVGINNTEYNLTYGRDVAGLDVLGYTANDFNITEDNWNRAVDLIRALHSESEFVVFPGTEWCGNSCAGGDHNVIFLHDRRPDFPFDNMGRSARSFEWNAEMKAATIEPGVWPLEDLWERYASDPEGHLLIPHVGGRRANLDWHHPALERLIEIGSTWGHFGWFYQEAIARGYKLGASAAGDEHRGRCGGGAPGAQVFGVKGGLTGIIAPSLTRGDIGKALRARHTWATTGERIVGLLSSGDSIQGDEVTVNGPAWLSYRLLGTAGWDHVAAHDHTGVIWERNLQAEAGYSDRRIRFRWGGARIKDRYRAAKWSGVLKITNAVIHSIKTYGFEHPEETAWRRGATEIVFNSETYGDADIIELEINGLPDAAISVEGTIGEYQKIGDARAHSPFVHCPTFKWDVAGSELLKAAELRSDLGGEGLFLALERLTDSVLPWEVSGDLEVQPENGPHGFRPIYITGRQIDDEKLWTSPLFVTFADVR